MERPVVTCCQCGAETFPIAVLYMDEQFYCTHCYQKEFGGVHEDQNVAADC